jgi:hypothetical protein
MLHYQFRNFKEWTQTKIDFGDLQQNNFAIIAPNAAPITRIIISWIPILHRSVWIGLHSRSKFQQSQAFPKFNKLS